MILTRQQVADRLQERLCDEADAIAADIPGLECIELEVEPDGHGEHRVYAKWGLSLTGDSQCLRDDLVEALLERVALLTGPATGVVTTKEHVIDIKVRQRKAEQQT